MNSLNRDQWKEVDERFTKEFHGLEDEYFQMFQEIKAFWHSELEKVRQETIEEDNKRFLGYVGEDEVLNNDPHDVFEDADKIAKNELRQELRDKVNKR